MKTLERGEERGLGCGGFNGVGSQGGRGGGGARGVEGEALGGLRWSFTDKKRTLHV